MAQVEFDTSLTDLERVKSHAMVNSEDYDAEITKLIKEVSSRIQRFLGRHVLSRQWVHDGLQTHKPRLDSHGGTQLFLPEMPITAVTTLKVYPTAEALVEGYDEDFVVHAEQGIIELVNGAAFYNAPKVVEITYTAGYLTATTSDQQSWLYGYDEASSEIRLGATILVALEFHQKQRLREGVASISSEGVSVQYLQDVERVWRDLSRYQVRMPSYA